MQKIRTGAKALQDTHELNGYEGSASRTMAKEEREEEEVKRHDVYKKLPH